MLEEYAALIDIVSNITVVGLLVVGLAAFYKGKIMSTDAVQSVIKNIMAEFRKELRGAVKDGMMDAHYEVNGGEKKGE
jgi:hypothetical protein